MDASYQLPEFTTLPRATTAGVHIPRVTLQENNPTSSILRQTQTLDNQRRRNERNREKMISDGTRTYMTETAGTFPKSQQGKWIKSYMYPNTGPLMRPGCSETVLSPSYDETDSRGQELEESLSKEVQRMIDGTHKPTSANSVESKDEKGPGGKAVQGVPPLMAVLKELQSIYPKSQPYDAIPSQGRALQEATLLASDSPGITDVEIPHDQIQDQQQRNVGPMEPSQPDDVKWSTQAQRPTSLAVASNYPVPSKSLLKVPTISQHPNHRASERSGRLYIPRSQSRSTPGDDSVFLSNDDPRNPYNDQAVLQNLPYFYRYKAGGVYKTQDKSCGQMCSEYTRNFCYFLRSCRFREGEQLKHLTPDRERSDNAAYTFMMLAITFSLLSLFGGIIYFGITHGYLESTKDDSLAATTFKYGGN